jgi:NAD(P)-dependent dehydrogenase (short-subunit alcohol dehydrogenase family)
MDVPLHDSLDGQVALVTGANRGIGAAIADGLVDRGATVYAGTRDRDAVDADDRRAIELDVTDVDSIADAVDRVERETGRLDVLVNNAGVGGPDGAVGDSSVAGIDRTLDTNLRGPILCARAALDLLLDSGGGRLVNVGSRGGQLSTGIDAVRGVYGISKVGLNGLTAHLHTAYNDDGLVVNSASPGWVRTGIGGDQAPRAPAEGADTPLWLARFTTAAPSGGFWHDRERIDW